MGRILKKTICSPHKSEYWLFPKETGIVEFKDRVSKISEQYISIAEGKGDKNTNYYSSDEKTGIQAISRSSVKAVKKGYVEKVESEYKRNGTQCLIGKILHLRQEEKVQLPAKGR